jgi:hypothetical protein
VLVPLPDRAPDSAGRAAGVVAAAVLADEPPQVVALDRGNISDSLMILLVLLAADAVCGALVDGRWWRLVLAGRVGGPGVPGQDARMPGSCCCPRSP